jgi:hypothetical protein
MMTNLVGHVNGAGRTTETKPISWPQDDPLAPPPPLLLNAPNSASALSANAAIRPYRNLGKERRPKTKRLHNIYDRFCSRTTEFAATPNLTNKANPDPFQNSRQIRRTVPSLPGNPTIRLQFGSSSEIA